eukprot:1161729-Pelagomonas_calceolata.AAC.3
MQSKLKRFPSSCPSGQKSWRCIAAKAVRKKEPLVAYIFTVPSAACHPSAPPQSTQTLKQTTAANPPCSLSFVCAPSSPRPPSSSSSSYSTSPNHASPGPPPLLPGVAEEAGA